MSALRGVRALLLDLDGVIVLAGTAVPGSVGRHRRAGPARRSPTGSSPTRRWSAGRACRGSRPGWATRSRPIVSSRALSTSAAYTARAFPGQPLYVISLDDARTEFEGQRLLTDEAARPGARVAAVIIGDSPEAS